MKFKEINKDQLTIKIESCSDEFKIYKAYALQFVNSISYPLEGFGQTRELALKDFFDKIKDVKPEFVEPDVNLEEKCFTGTISMGNGQASLIKMQLLKAKIEYACGMLSGMQQNGGQGTQFDYDEDKQSCKIMNEIIKDITTALHCEPVKNPDACKKCTDGLIHCIDIQCYLCLMDNEHRCEFARKCPHCNSDEG